MKGLICNLIKIQFLLSIAAAAFVACSSDGGVASVLIESNSGNKVLIETNTGSGSARVLFSVDELAVSEGDTLQLSRTRRDTVGDTIHVTSYYTEDIVNASDVMSGVVSMENVPAGSYDSLSVLPVNGAPRTLPMPMTVKESETYRMEGLQQAVSKVMRASIHLPEGFEQFASMDETFGEMPFPIRLDSPTESPCLVDALGRMILLEGAAGDSLLFWGKMEEVVFAEDGSIRFEVLEGCNMDRKPALIARHVEHLDENAPSEAATARFDLMDAAFGNALWTDSTDQWLLIENFKPFTREGTQMSASFWVKADSASQPSPGKNYTRYLSAKADSMGFMVQQRGDHPTINVRIDAHRNGIGVYNTVYGYADILDGTWHNYSLTIRGDSLYAWADGVNVARVQFENGGDFAEVINPTIGYDRNNMVGGMDEVFFLDGSQSENWMKLFYALQKQARDKE